MRQRYGHFGLGIYMSQREAIILLETQIAVSGRRSGRAPVRAELASTAGYP